jgi:hypothetical protein
MNHISDSHAGRPADAAPDADNNLGRGAPYDRDERVQQKRRNEARSIEEPGVPARKEESVQQRRRASSKARPSKRGE